MRVLIIGSNGLLGQNLVHTAPASWHLGGLGSAPVSVTASQPQSKLQSYRQVDITQASALRTAIADFRPDWLVNAAALTDVDRCEREPALAAAINRDAVGVMADTGIPLAHVSTDYVFDGVSGPYREDDAVGPLSVYGQTKLASEALALGARPGGLEQNIVVRTMLLWGLGHGTKTQFPDFIRNTLQAGKRVRIVTDQIGHPTLAHDLAEAIWALIGKSCHGLYHAAGADCMSRLEWTQAIAAFYRLDTALIDTCVTADLGQAAKRPLRSGLVSDKLARDTGYRLRGVHAQLDFLAKSV